jgi:hypothetical protein
VDVGAARLHETVDKERHQYTLCKAYCLGSPVYTLADQLCYELGPSIQVRSDTVGADVETNISGYSFGNPNAQPPTPTQTPTQAQFPSPTFQTPRNSSSFEDRSGWTPTFAEEYSVFNATPGRLTTNQHHFVEASTPHQITTSILERHPSVDGDIIPDLRTAAQQLSPNPTFSLPPVNLSSQVPSSPDPYSSVSRRFDDSSKPKVTPRKPKKRLEEAFSAQTATPPQTTSKGSRKLAPKLAEAMQDSSQHGQYGIEESPSQQHPLLQFPTTSADLFGYPMSAPATAPVFTSTKPFWDPDTSMSGMDFSFTTDTASMSHIGGHRVSNSFDWGKSNQMFQDTVNMPSSQPAPQTKPQTTPTQPPTKKQRPLAPKVSVPPTPEISTSQASFDFLNTTPNWNEPFSATSIGSVDPGLLFSRNITSTMPSEFEDVILPATRPSTSHIVREPYQHQMREAREQQDAIRRARSSRESSSNRRFERGTASSPVKGSARPGLQRSFSDNRGRRPGKLFNPKISTNLVFTYFRSVNTTNRPSFSRETFPTTQSCPNLRIAHT